MGRRVAWISLLLGGLIFLAAGASEYASAQDGGRAALVVRFADDRVESRCVAFEETEINGYTLLQRSGLSLDVKSEGQGGLVCAIEGTGCGVDNCLCECQGEPCVYWSYWRLGEEGWAYSAAGATVRRLSNGDVDGWSWGPGSVTSAIEPPDIAFEDVCNDEAAVFDGSTSQRPESSSGWAPYVVFGALVLVIGVTALVASRRRNLS